MAKAKVKPKITEPAKAAKVYTAADIIDMVNKKTGSSSFTELLDQMEADFNLYALTPYTAEAGHQSYTSPAPKNDFNKVLAGLNKASLTWQIVTAEDAPEKERNAASDGEKLITGVLDKADRQLRSIGEPQLRQGLGWFACARGIAGLKCLIYADDNKNTTIDIRPLDSMHMAWEQGSDGLVWGAFLYHISKAEALDRYGITLTSNEDAIIIDFFDRTNNAVVFSTGSKSGNQNSQFVKDPTPHGLGHVPIWVGFSSGMPTVYTKENLPTLKYRAASVYSSSRGIYEPRNKQVSFIMDTAEKSVAGTLVYETEEGKKGIEGDPFGSWKVIKLKTGEILHALEPPKVPPESAAVMSILDKDKQESTVPYPIGYGLDPQAHSGAALSMMNDSTRSVYGPFTSLLEDAYRWLCEEILTQFKTKGQKLTLKGFDSNGKFFSLDANPGEVRDDWYIQVKCEPKLPRDEAGELQMAIAATRPRPNGVPLISDITAYEKIIKLPNPDAEQTRIQEQLINGMIDSNPVIQVRRIAKALLDKGDIQGAKEFLMSIPTPQAQQTRGKANPSATPGAPQGNLSPEVMATIQQVSQQLGIPPEDVANMPSEQVKAMLAEKQGGIPPIMGG